VKKIYLFLCVLLILSSIVWGSTILTGRTSLSPDKLLQGLNLKPYLPYFAAGKLYFEIGDLEQAREMFKKTVEINPNFAPGYHNLGVVYYYSGNINGAKDALNEAILIDKSYSKAYSALGILYFEQEEYKEAIESFDKANKLGVDEADVHFNLAQSLVADFRKNEEIGKIDVEELKDAVSHMQRVEMLSPGREHVASNIKIIENVISSYEST
jgi:tetratricopeptide (TPR) repeat protein